MWRLPFERIYSTEVKDEWEGLGDGGREINLTIDDDEVPEPLVGGIIDLGEAATEHLALEIDPFPRNPDLDNQLGEFARDENSRCKQRDQPVRGFECNEGDVDKERVSGLLLLATLFI